MFICECGEMFEELGEETREHVLEMHLDLVESEFEDAVAELEFSDIPAWTGDKLYDQAIEDVEEELMDEIISEEE